MNQIANEDAATNSHGSPTPSLPAWRLRLYVAGGSSGSLHAINLMQRLCAERPDTHLEIVDIYAEDFASKHLPEAGVVTAPSVVRLAPGPVAVYVGEFTDEHALAPIFKAADGE